jgi:hypothetical protein
MTMWSRKASNKIVNFMILGVDVLRLLTSSVVLLILAVDLQLSIKVFGTDGLRAVG